jgi:hypothetical protein
MVIGTAEFLNRVDIDRDFDTIVDALDNIICKLNDSADCIDVDKEDLTRNIQRVQDMRRKTLKIKKRINNISYVNSIF